MVTDKIWFLQVRKSDKDRIAPVGNRALHWLQKALDEAVRYSHSCEERLVADLDQKLKQRGGQMIEKLFQVPQKVAQTTSSGAGGRASFSRPAWSSKGMARTA